MFRITGRPANQKVFRQIANIPRNIEVGIRSANTLIGRQVQKDIRADMRRPKHGKRYVLREFWRGEKDVVHRASAPGEAPAVFTGSLSASVNYVASSSQLVIGAGNEGGSVPMVKRVRYIDLGGQVGFGRTVNYALKLETVMRRFYLRKNVMFNYRNINNYYSRQIARKMLRI